MKSALGVLAAWLSLVTFAEQAHAIPVFARRYRTSCITCHAGFPKLNSMGEAFRRNGYQFPRDDEDMVKDEPILLGTEAWKEMWPDSIWPSDIPNLPPVALRAKLGFNSFFDAPAGAPKTDFQMPQSLSLMSAANLGKDISYWISVELEPEEDEVEIGIERAFIQFNNLFAWSEEDDEDGMRVASRWLALPKHALNLRVGQFEPQVIAPWASNHRRLGIAGRLTNVATIGGNRFRFEPALRGIEANGVIRQYNSYAIGLVNGNGVGFAFDNNSKKDFYFRVARKWWGYPFDGQIAPIGGDEEEEAPSFEVSHLGVRPGFQRRAKYASAVFRGQSPEDEDAYQDEDEGGATGLEFWREMQFETGFLGYFGNNAIEDPVETRDRFQRIGFDARWQSGDLDVFGAWILGRDDDLGTGSEESLFTWFLEADYYFKPWMIGYLRYEELTFQRSFEHRDVRRLIPGAAFYVRTNVRVVAEIQVDTSGQDTTSDALQLVIDVAY